MSERTRATQNVVNRRVDRDELGHIRARLDASRSIRDAVAPRTSQHFNRDVLEEMRDVEHSAQVGASGYTMTRAYVGGWTPTSHRVIYETPEGDSEEETIVTFARGSGAQVEHYAWPGTQNALALNGDLYEARQPSNGYATGQYSPDRETVMRLDKDGKYAGVVELVIDKQ